MSGLAEREAQFEAKFAHDEELRFKMRCRRDKLFGLWLAEKFGIADAENYANGYVAADFQSSGDHDVYDKAVQEVAARQADISSHMLQKHLGDCLAEAEKQIMQEG